MAKTENQQNFLKKKRKPLNNYLKYTGLAFQFMAAVLLGFWAGSWLDSRYQTNKPWFTMGFMIFFLIATLYKVIRDIANE